MKFKVFTVTGHRGEQCSSQHAEQKDVHSPHVDLLFLRRWWRWTQLLFNCSKGLLNPLWCSISFIKIRSFFFFQVVVVSVTNFPLSTWLQEMQLWVAQNTRTYTYMNILLPWWILQVTELSISPKYISSYGVWWWSNIISFGWDLVIVKAWQSQHFIWVWWDELCGCRFRHLSNCMRTWVDRHFQASRSASISYCHCCLKTPHMMLPPLRWHWGGDKQVSIFHQRWHLLGALLQTCCNCIAEEKLLSGPISGEQEWWLYPWRSTSRTFGFRHNLFLSGCHSCLISMFLM